MNTKDYSSPSGIPFAAGTVLEPSWDDRPIRVVTSDEIEILYDAWWPHRSAWGTATLRGRASYYRISTPFALPKVKILRAEPFTPAEHQVHRPDLPLRCCRVPGVTWEEIHGLGVETLAQLIERKAAGILEDFIPAPELVVEPFGPNGGPKRAVKIHAGDRGQFSAVELLKKAAEVQASCISSRPDGVGLFRLGIQQKTPSFYLWGWRDRANNTKD